MILKIGLISSPILFLVAGFLIFTPKIFAQTCPAADTQYPRYDGLLSAFGVTGNFGGQNSICISGDDAPLPPADIDKFFTYDSLKYQYYDQNKDSAVKNTPWVGGSKIGGVGTLKDGLTLVQGDLKVDIQPVQPIKPVTAVVFVEGNLVIRSDFEMQSPDKSINAVVFVVRGNIYIDHSVNLIDAFLISEGADPSPDPNPNTDVQTICTNATTYTGSSTTASCNAPDYNDTTIRQLKVVGGLVSLSSYDNIKFTRDLTAFDGNQTPAESVVGDPKYLVVLRELFSNTENVTSEDTSYGLNAP